MTFGSSGMRRAAKVASVLAFFGSLAAAMPAAAGPMKIGESYSERGGAVCNTSPYCRADNFTAVPAGNILTITRVSCFVMLHKESIVQSMAAGRQTGTLGASNILEPQHLVPVRTGQGSFIAYYHANNEVQITLSQNMRPAVIVSFLGSNHYSNSVDCTVTGHLTAPR